MRDDVNGWVTLEKTRAVVAEIRRRQEASGRDYPVPQLSARQREKLAKRAAMEAAIAAQAEEDAMMAEIEAKQAEGASSGVSVECDEVAPVVPATVPDQSTKVKEGVVKSKCVVQ